MKKILVFIFSLLVVIGGAYFFINKTSEDDVIRMNLDNPEEVFNIEAPADFNDFKKERLEKKILQAKELYNDLDKRQDTWTWIVVGNLYEYAKDYDRAIIVYEHTLSLQSAEVMSLGNLAYIYENYKPDFEKAEYYYKRLLETNAGVPKYNIDLARFYDNKIDDQDKAEEVYLNGLSKTKNNQDVLVAIIRFYEKHGNQDKAREYAKLLIEINPSNEIYKKDFSHLVD